MNRRKKKHESINKINETWNWMCVDECEWIELENVINKVYSSFK